MGLFRRENGFYYIKFRQGDGRYKRITLETKDRHLAQEIYHTYLREKVLGKLTPSLLQAAVPVRSAPLPLQAQEQSMAAAFKAYGEYCQGQGLSSGIMNSKERLLKVLKQNKAKVLGDITQKLVNEISQNYSPDTANRHMRNLKAFLNFCIKKQWYERRDYEAFHFPMHRDKVRETIMSEAHYRQILSAVKDKDADFYLFLELLWQTGCRPNELSKLSKDSIDFPQGIADVYQTKTKKRKTIYLSDELLKKLALCEGHIFIGASKQKEYYAKKFKSLKEDLHLPKEYCLYTFRHSFGTRMMNKTKDIHLVSKLMGHADISITAKHYINRDSGQIRKLLLG